MIDSDIEALWHGQESPKTTVTTNAQQTEIGLAGGRYRVIMSHGQRVWTSKDGSCKIDPNTPLWDAIDSVVGLLQ